MITLKKQVTLVIIAFILVPFFISPVLATLSQETVLVNGDFEDWASESDANSWIESPVTANITRETTTVHNGTYSVKIIRESDETVPSQLSQNVTVEKGKQYTFSVYVLDNDPDIDVRLMMGHGEEIVYGKNSTDKAEWQKIDVTATVTDEQCRISVVVYSNLAEGTVYIDLAEFKFSGIPLIEAIPASLIWIVGILATGALVFVCLYLGYKKKTHEPLNSTRVLTQVAVFSALGFVLSFFSIPMPLDTHLAFHLYPAYLISFAYGPYVGLIVGAITGSKGMLTGNWTGPVSNAIFCMVVGAMAMYMNPEKRGRPLYIIFFNVLINTWVFGLLHMAYTFSGLVVPMLVVLNLILSMPNNFIYAILVEATIRVEQIWDPLTEDSNLIWYQDDYKEPPAEVQKKNTTIQLLVFNALLYGWFAVIWLSPSFEYFGMSLNLYNPLLFVLMMAFVVILLVACLIVYRVGTTGLASVLTLVGSILTLPVGLLSLYVWIKYLRKSDQAPEEIAA